MPAERDEHPVWPEDEESVAYLTHLAERVWEFRLARPTFGLGAAEPNE